MDWKLACLMPIIRPEERGASQTALNWGTQMESAVLNHVFQEFWPDIRKNVFRQK